METVTFNYNDNNYILKFLPNDLSANGAIDEIVRRNEYKLNNFKYMENKVFIDIGANFGVATLIMAKQNPKSMVYSFEPNREVFECLKESISINNLQNVKLYNKAVSKPNVKFLTLLYHNQWSGANTTYSELDIASNFNFNKTKKEIVECISFDEIIQNNNIKEIEVLKIDCEGAEFDIIFESKLFKNNIVKNIVGEFHDLQYNIHSSNNVNELLTYCKKYVNNLVHITLLKI